MYENSNLQFFNHTEGYITPNGSSFKYVYQYKDHLGNVRLSYNDADGSGTIATSEIIEENNYYPFGLKHKGYNTNVGAGGNSTAERFKHFQGQERDESLGLNVDFWKYRVSDPAIGRFWQIDPLAEEYSYQSVYNFSENRVIDARELEGLEASGVVRKLIKKTPKAAIKTGRKGRQARLKSVLNDPKASRADKGWVKQEMNQIQRRKRKNIRNPPGKDLAHERGREAAKGYGYEFSNLQDGVLHKIQHKFDNFGRKNKERPVTEVLSSMGIVSVFSNHEDGSTEQDSSDGDDSVTGSATLDGIFNASYAFISFFDNLGSTIFGEGTDAAIIANDLNPLNFGVSEIFKPVKEDKEKKDNDKE